MQNKLNLKTYTFTDGDFSIYIYVSEENGNLYMKQTEIASLLEISQSTVSKNIKNIDASKWDIYSKNEQIGINLNGKEVEYYGLKIIKEIGQKYNPERIEKLENWLDEILNGNMPVSYDDSLKIVRYNHNNLNLKVKVDFANHTAWLTQDQMSLILGTSASNISQHIAHIYDDEELEIGATLKNFLIVRFEGNREVKRYVDHYNVDMLIAIGYRVKTKEAIIFRTWVSGIVSGYITNGYVVDDSRFKVLEKNNLMMIEKIDEINDKIQSHDERIETIEKWKNNDDIPKEVIFDNGQYVEADEYLIKIIKSATTSIDIVDNYLDYKVIVLLKNKRKGVAVRLLTSNYSKLDTSLIDDFNKEYGDLSISYKSVFHDRYYIVDKSIGYHVGPSINYAGKNIGGSNKMNEDIIVQFVLSKIDECFL